VKYLITAVPITISTRRRCGSSFTDLVDTHLTSALNIEQSYEFRWMREHPESRVKVIDVRPLPAVREGRCLLCGNMLWRHYDVNNRKLACEAVK
jgi:hypothetical protein